MRRLVIVAVSAVLASSAAAEEHRELGAHQHGHGTFNLAIEGSHVSMELEAPGADIVGFEHPAQTPEQKAAVEKATTTLASPLSVFKVPEAAGCRIVATSVRLEADEEHEDKAAKSEAKSDAKPETKAAEHSDFHAEYGLECTNTKAISSIVFDYFRAFPGAQELDVTVVTDKGQNKFEVTRANPRIDIGGLM